MTLVSVAPVIDENGIMAPTFTDILIYLKEQYWLIYGEDAYLENDSLDGQFLGILALAISDVNAACVQVYNSFSPKTARSDALTRNVKINGIHRSQSTYSTADISITGQAGIAINNGIVGDSNGNNWLLPQFVTIGPSGVNTVTATAEKSGAVFAPAGSINSIVTPTRGWLGVSNQNSSSIGQDEEQDIKLRQRQALSVSIQSQSMLDGLRGAILALPNVTRCKIIENSTDATDENKIPCKSMCVIAYGGDSKEIAQLIHIKKSMGCGLYGNTEVTVLNTYGESDSIQFYRPDVVNISYKLNISTNDTYSADTGDVIKQLLAEYTNALDINDKITQNKLYGASNLYGAEQSQTYEVDNITIQANGIDFTGDYILPFGAVAFCDLSTIEIEVISG